MNVTPTSAKSPSLLARIYPQIGVLFLAQALLMINNVTFITINALAGAALAPNPMLATLPIAAQVLAAALCTYPASLLMAKFGRRVGFSVGAAFGWVGAALAALGMVQHSLWLLCAGTFLAGVYNGMGQYLRFAAADAAQQYLPSFKAQAIALVLAGGVVGGIVGPEMAKLTRAAYETVFVGTYLTLACFALLAIALIQCVRLPSIAAPAPVVGERVLTAWQILAQPKVRAAVVCGAVAYGLMNLLMVATPLAMQVCGYGFNDIAWVIEWHVVAMFAPGFVTGKLNDRFGVQRMMYAGGALFVLAAVINLLGSSVWHFWLALTVLGLGWNWLFTGATTLLTTTYSPSQKARVQGINDAAVFSTMVFSSLSSGVLVVSHGYALMNAVSIPIVLGAMWVLWKHGK